MSYYAVVGADISALLPNINGVVVVILLLLMGIPWRRASSGWADSSEVVRVGRNERSMNIISR